GLRGRVLTVDGPADNLAQTPLQDRAASAVVDRGLWEVCEAPYYRGRCVTLRPGQYPSLGSLDLTNRIASVRPVRGAPQYAAPQPAPPPAYEYYPHYGEQLYQADVVAVRAVVGPPEQRCWVEQQQVVQQNQPNIAGAVIGGVLGGVLGHQIGGGVGKSIATGVGAVGGAALGANVNRGTSVKTQDVQRCESVPGAAGLWGRYVRVQGRDPSRAAQLRAGRDDPRQRPRRAESLSSVAGSPAGERASERHSDGPLPTQVVSPADIQSGRPRLGFA